MWKFKIDMELKFSPVHFSLPPFLVTCFSNALARFQFCLKSLRTIAHQPRLFTAEFYGSNFYYNQYLEPFVTRSNSSYSVYHASTLSQDIYFAESAYIVWSSTYLFNTVSSYICEHCEVPSLTDTVIFSLSECKMVECTSRAHCCCT